MSAGYARIPHSLLDEYGEQLGPYGLSIYMAICRFANAELVCWPSVLTLAKRTGMSRRQALKQINLLEELKLIEITPQYDPETKEHRSNLYKLILPGGMAPHAVGGNAPRAVPNAPRADRSKTKNYHSDSVIEEKKNYRPEHLRGIILG